MQRSDHYSTYMCRHTAGEETMAPRGNLRTVSKLSRHPYRPYRANSDGKTNRQTLMNNVRSDLFCTNSTFSSVLGPALCRANSCDRPVKGTSYPSLPNPRFSPLTVIDITYEREVKNKMSGRSALTPCSGGALSPSSQMFERACKDLETEMHTRIHRLWTNRI
jgi:hypothetical protein